MYGSRYETEPLFNDERTLILTNTTATTNHTNDGYFPGQ